MVRIVQRTERSQRTLRPDHRIVGPELIGQIERDLAVAIQSKAAVEGSFQG